MPCSRNNVPRLFQGCLWWLPGGGYQQVFMCCASITIIAILPRYVLDLGDLVISGRPKLERSLFPLYLGITMLPMERSLKVQHAMKFEDIKYNAQSGSAKVHLSVQNAAEIRCIGRWFSKRPGHETPSASHATLPFSTATIS